MSAPACAEAEILALRERVAANEAVIEQLQRQIAWLRKQIFGSKSERVDQRQLELMLQGLEDQVNELKQPEPPAVALPAKRAARTPQRGRDERYSHLPVRETVVIEPPEVQGAPEAFERIGEEETFEIDVDPPKFFRRRLLRPKYRRKADREAAPVVAPAPSRPVEGLASIGLLVHVILSKYCDHLPLYRQSRMYERYGVQISRQNMMRWVETVADWLKPIYHHMCRDLLEGGYIQADETPIKYLDADLKARKAQQGYLCGYSRPGGNVVFTWRTSRSTESLTSWLSGYKGILQCDAYAAYLSYARQCEAITVAGCMAHVRRKFHDVKDEHPRYVALILRLIGNLYECERQCRAAALPPKLVWVRRQSHARELFGRLHRVIRHIAGKTLPASGLGKACGYALNQWEHLGHYLDHGQVQIDNNLMENAIRPSAIGKKNWMFIGHPSAGERSAIIYSLLGSCQRFGHNPSEYLKDVLTRLAEQPDRFHPREPAALAPRHWKPRD